MRIDLENAQTAKTAEKKFFACFAPFAFFFRREAKCAG